MDEEDERAHVRYNSHVKLREPAPVIEYKLPTNKRKSDITSLFQWNLAHPRRQRGEPLLAATGTNGFGDNPEFRCRCTAVGKPHLLAVVLSLSQSVTCTYALLAVRRRGYTTMRRATTTTLLPGNLEPLATTSSAFTPTGSLRCVISQRG